MNANQLWVVKLGGSLLGSVELSQWLALLAKQGKRQVVIVPGGGVFADAVRLAQKLSRIDDALAHELALLAMDQFGLLLTGMQSGLVTAASELEIAERGWQHKTVVWLPSKMVLADTAVEQSWRVTSDSLSAWLASKLGADQLLVIKSIDLCHYLKHPHGVAAKLLADEVIDARFLESIAGQAYQTSLLNKSDSALFESELSAPCWQEKALLI